MTEKKVILVIDNNESNRAIFETYLEMHGFAVCFTENKEPAQQRAEKLLPDIILLNITGPEPDECQILERIKNNPVLSNIPTIVLSVKSLPDDLLDVLRKNADEFFIKPFDAQKCIARIKQLLHLNKNQDIVKLTTHKIKKQNLIKINFKFQAKQVAAFHS